MTGKKRASTRASGDALRVLALDAIVRYQALGLRQSDDVLIAGIIDAIAVGSDAE